MNPREFIQKYKKEIIAEPSGRPYDQLVRDQIKEFVLIKSQEK